MGAKRKQHSVEFKAQVAMAALSGDKTLAGLASEFGVHPTMISAWKQELVKNAKALFERGNKKTEDPQKIIDHLHRKIGQLQVERDLAGRCKTTAVGHLRRCAVRAPSPIYLICLGRCAPCALHLAILATFSTAC
jgi:transposase-like protein